MVYKHAYLNKLVLLQCGLSQRGEDAAKGGGGGFGGLALKVMEITLLIGLFPAILGKGPWPKLGKK